MQWDFVLNKKEAVAATLLVNPVENPQHHCHGFKNLGTAQSALKRKERREGGDVTTAIIQDEKVGL